MEFNYKQLLTCTLLLAGSMLIGGAVFAQEYPKDLVTLHPAKSKIVEDRNDHLPSAYPQRSAGAANVNVIWEEDFSGGIPGTWTNTGSFSGQTAKWEYRGPNTSPDTSTGSRGAYSSGTRVASVSPQNGFVIFDSDYLDNGGIPGNFDGGPSPTPHWSYLETETMNLSTEPQVVLEFYQYFRQFYSFTYVVFSQDSGTTYPDTIMLNDGFPIAPNLSTAFDDYVVRDVSSLIGGEALARMKFVFESDPAISAGINGYYFWQIDDIRLVRKPYNDLALIPWMWGPANDLLRSRVIADGRLLDYKYLPKEQLGQLTFEAVVENKGRADQPNTSVNFDVIGPSGFNQTTASNLLEVDEAGVYDNSSTPFIPGPIGQYAVTMTTSSDSTDRDPDGWRPSNNTYTVDFNVSDSTMGIASQNAGTTGTSIGTNSFPNTQDGIRLANLIELTHADTITSVTIGLSQNTRSGAVIHVTVRDTTPGLDIGFLQDFSNVLVSSDFYVITTQDSINGYATISIPKTLSSVPQNRVLPPDWYFVSAELFSSAGTTPIAILDDYTVLQPQQASIFFHPGQQRWFTNGNAFHIWANFGRPPKVVPDTIQVFACDTFAAPSGKVYTQSGIYNDTIFGASGDSLKITYDAIKSGDSCRLLGENKVYMFSGLGTSHPLAFWEYTVGNWGLDDGLGELKPAGPTDVWEITIHVRDYYSQAVNGPVPPNDTLYNIGIVFRNEDGSMVGMDDSCVDIAVRGVNTPNPWVENWDGTPFDGVQAEWISGGQDSVVVYDLTIQYNSYDTINPSACGSYTAPDGTLYTQGGTYISIISNSAGCDSIITINLSLTPGDYDTIAPVACDTYTAPDGAVYTSSGTYTSILQNQAGCDSVITIHLTINRYSTNTISPVACGEYQAPDGSIFSSSGTYDITLTNSLGCDSLLTIQLTIENVDTTVAQNGPILTSNQAGAQYQWFICDTLGGYTVIGGANNQSYTATANGWYAVEIITSNCSDTSDCVNVTSIGNDWVAGKEEHWKVQPNPTAGQFRVGGVLHSPDKVTMEIRAVTGALVETKTIEATNGKHSEAFDISNQPSGLYVLIIRSGNRQWQYRLVVE